VGQLARYESRGLAAGNDQEAADPLCVGAEHRSQLEKSWRHSNSWSVPAAAAGQRHSVFDGWSFRELSAGAERAPNPVLQAFLRAATSTGRSGGRWRHAHGPGTVIRRSGPSQFVTLDLRERREFGGLTIAWQGKGVRVTLRCGSLDDGSSGAPCAGDCRPRRPRFSCVCRMRRLDSCVCI